MVQIKTSDFELICHAAVSWTSQYCGGHCGCWVIQASNCFRVEGLCLMLVLQDVFFKEWSLVCLENLSGGISLPPASILTCSFATLYRRASLGFFLLSSGVGHFSCPSIVSTGEVLWYLLVTYLADLLCIISSVCLSFCRWGSHTDLAYSTVGLTNAVYAFSLVSLFAVFKFL